MNAFQNIDWSSTGSMLQGLGTVAGVLAVIWGAVNAANTWKQQKQAERRLEIAERIITATHKGRNALAYVRGIMMWAHELAEAEKSLKQDLEWGRQTESRQKRLVTAQAYYNRINKTRDEQAALVECLPMARALFGRDMEKALEELRRQFWIVQVNVDSYIDDEGVNDIEFTKKIRRAMYDVQPIAGEINEVSQTISESVLKIETACEPALRLETVK